MNWNPKLSDKKKIEKLDKLFETSKKKLQIPHFEWYLNNMFIDGNHYAYYNTNTKTIETPPRSRGEVRIVINKTRSSIRAIKNFATRERPKWYTMPSDLDDETITNARRSGKVLDYLFRHLFMDTLIEGMVEQVLNTSVAWVELDWDADDTIQGQIRIRLHDSFDIFPEMGAGVYKGKFNGDYLFKAITKDVDSVKADKRYDKEKRAKVTSDDEIAASTMKARLIRKREGSSDKENKVMVKEAQVRDGKDFYMITYGGGQVLKEKKLKEYSLYPMQIPLDPLRIIHRSWVADAIPLNKAIDRTISQKIMYVNQALVFRIIAEKGHGVNKVSNEMGEILEINKNRIFKQWEMQPLPSSLDSLTSDLSMMFEDILGAHDAALGRLPPGARSGKTLEALQAADSNNLAGITKGLRSILTVIGRRMLEIAAEKYSTTRVIELTDPEDGQKFIEVIGEKAPDDLKKKGAAIISGDTEVIVDIGSWLGHTKGEQRDTLVKLVELGALPADELLRQMEFPNIDDLSSRAKEERLEQHKLDAEIAGRGGQAGGQPGAQGAAADQGVQLVDEENMVMMNGEPLPPSQGIDMAHTQGHIDFTQSPSYAQATPEINQIFEQHIQGELASHGML